MEERNNLLKKIKDPLSLEMWIFRNGQPEPDRDDDCIICVATTYT